MDFFNFYSAPGIIKETIFINDQKMSSNLVETISINYEDFNDSFLTCGTCLCMYDALSHTPKLLHCSHTVCRDCLERIVEAQGNDNLSFRCPICRETINVPRGGVSAFPPSFIVNQLIDLMTAQRRDVIPKCSVHTRVELLFCETCDNVFCRECTGDNHNGRGASAHTVIPFSIAIKRMSEILLYKASLCMNNLNNACDIVNQEIHKLDTSTELCIDAVSKNFQDLLNVIEERRMEVIQMVKSIREEKTKVLQEQLNIIQTEKNKVQEDCNGLHHQVEVRNISKKICDLNEKLDISSTLLEPRENSFMKFEFKHNSALCDLINSLNNFGRIRISKTFPALCNAVYEDDFSIHIKTCVNVYAVDYHGNSRTSGGDPVEAEFRNPSNEIIPCDVIDKDNGVYSIIFTPEVSGLHKLYINIFNRLIKDSPINIDVSIHNNPIHKVGVRGNDDLEFIQPVGVVVDRNRNIYVLDAGNSRITTLNFNKQFLTHICGVGFEMHSTTGISLTPRNNVIVVNWRTKFITEFDQNGDVVYRFTSAEFKEPTSITVNCHGEIIVADNGVGSVLVFNPNGTFLYSIGNKGQFKGITSVYACSNDDILVTDTRILLFNRQGKFIKEIGSGSKIKGQYGGVTMDLHGNTLATRTEKGKAFVQVFNSSAELFFEIDSFNDRLKRPSGLCTLPDGQVIVVDLGNDCIKAFRYK